MIKKQQILLQASDLFMTNGFKSITMDDIAKKLIISKRTLYEVFKSKKALVLSIVQNHIDIQLAQLDKLEKSNNNAIDNMIQSSNFIFKMHGKMRPSALFDLKKFYPSIWTIIDKFHSNIIKKKIELNLTLGIEQGLYRKSINPEIISELYTIQLQLFSTKTKTNKGKTDIEELLDQFFEYHLYGILSPSGIEYYLNLKK